MHLCIVHKKSGTSIKEGKKVSGFMRKDCYSQEFPRNQIVKKLCLFVDLRILRKTDSTITFDFFSESLEERPPFVNKMLCHL